MCICAVRQGLRCGESRQKTSAFRGGERERDTDTDTETQQTHTSPAHTHTCYHLQQINHYITVNAIFRLEHMYHFIIDIF